MDAFLAVANYPQLNQKDYNWINDYRKKNDDYYDMINAHFSFVFPTCNFEPDDFIKEIKKQASGVQKIKFQIKCVLRNNDQTNDYWHVLLVPDKGFSDIVKLQGKLHSGLLFPTQRLDLDFIPHIAIGNSKDTKKCKIMVDEINSMDINICGVIKQLEIIQLKDNKISTLDIVKLV